MPDDISNELVAELLAGGKSKTPQDGTSKTKFIRRYMHYPSKHTQHFRHVDETLRCASRGCSSPTNTKVEGIPYCVVHAFFALSVIIDRLEGELNAAKRANRLIG